METSIPAPSIRGIREIRGQNNYRFQVEIGSTVFLARGMGSCGSRRRERGVGMVKREMEVGLSADGADGRERGHSGMRTKGCVEVRNEFRARGGASLTPGQWLPSLRDENPGLLGEGRVLGISAGLEVGDQVEEFVAIEAVDEAFGHEGHGIGMP